MNSLSVSVDRFEYKYMIPFEIFILIKNNFDKLLKKDEYGNGKYMIRSLYFDSYNNADFFNKIAGIEKRKKIRLRIYDINQEKCKLEMKVKNRDMQKKISLWITKEDSLNLIAGKYNILIKYFDDENAILLYKEMQLGCYKPVTIVEYERHAYVYPFNNVRLTFDMNIKSSEFNNNLYKDKILYKPQLINYVILEIKFNKQLPKFISDILKKYNLTQQAYSKYYFGRQKFYEY